MMVKCAAQSIYSFVLVQFCQDQVVCVVCDFDRFLHLHNDFTDRQWSFVGASFSMYSAHMIRTVGPVQKMGIRSPGRPTLHAVSKRHVLQYSLHGTGRISCPYALPGVMVAARQG